MVFEGLWSPQTHPKDFPTKALWLTHFSDVIGATHLKNFSFWGEGQIATDGFRYLFNVRSLTWQGLSDFFAVVGGQCLANSHLIIGGCYKC